MKKYALYPGSVRSINDGQVHYINGMQLARLYGVALDECVVVLPDRSSRDLLNLIPLGPKANGDYRLPNAKN